MNEAGKVEVLLAGLKFPEAPRWYDAIPGARFAVIAGAPHMLFIEQPHAVANEIIAFLDEVCGAG